MKKNSLLILFGGVLSIVTLGSLFLFSNIFSEKKVNYPKEIVLSDQCEGDSWVQRDYKTVSKCLEDSNVICSCIKYSESGSCTSYQMITFTRICGSKPLNEPGRTNIKNDKGGFCLYDSDCSEGLKCVSRLCITEAEAAAKPHSQGQNCDAVNGPFCDKSYQCVGGICVKDVQCTEHEQCGSGKRCYHSMCVDAPKESQSGCNVVGCQRCTDYDPNRCVVCLGGRRPWDDGSCDVSLDSSGNVVIKGTSGEKPDEEKKNAEPDDGSPIITDQQPDNETLNCCNNGVYVQMKKNANYSTCADAGYTDLELEGGIYTCKNGQEKPTNIQKKGIGALCNDNSECESNNCKEDVFGKFCADNSDSIEKDTEPSHSSFIYSGSVSYSSEAPSACQYVKDGNLEAPEANANSSDKLCQYTISKDTEKCNGSEDCYQIVNYVKEDNPLKSNSGVNWIKIIYVVLIVVVASMLIYTLAFYGKKK